MSQLRKDIVTGDWVTISTKRAKRPNEFDSKEKSNCPFCKENIHMTPKDIFSSSTYGIRVVPNKYPAFHDDQPYAYDDFFNVGVSYGFHEVVIDTEKHDQKMFSFDNEHLATVLNVIKMRVEELEKKENIAYVQVFKNSGVGSGASLKHSHWQIIAMPMVSLKQQIILDNLNQYQKEKNSCLICDSIKKEISEKVRIIAENDNFVAYTPFASKFTYEIKISPKEHVCNFKYLEYVHLKDLASILALMLKGLEQLKKDMPYNICFFNGVKDVGHFELQIIPRLGNFAGFELGTGCYINSVYPETAAENLRNIIGGIIS